MSVAELIDTCLLDEPEEIGRTKTGKFKPTGPRRKKARIRARRRVVVAMARYAETVWSDRATAFPEMNP